MNHVELKEKIHSAAYTLLQEKNYVSPIEVLIKINILSVKDYEDWRFGRVQYLEIGDLAECNTLKRYVKLI